MRKYVCACGHEGFSAIDVVSGVCCKCGGVMLPVGAVRVQGMVYCIDCALYPEKCARSNYDYCTCVDGRPKEAVVS